MNTEKCPGGPLERLVGRLLDHAQLHDDVCPHDDEQVQWAHDMRDAVALLRSQADEIERLQADAARYRWLRDAEPSEHWNNAIDALSGCSPADDVDDIIDSAMQADQPPNAALSGPHEDD